MEMPVSCTCGLEKCPKWEKKGWIDGPQAGKEKKLRQALRREQQMLREGVSPKRALVAELQERLPKKCMAFP